MKKINEANKRVFTYSGIEDVIKPKRNLQIRLEATLVF